MEDVSPPTAAASSASSSSHLSPPTITKSTDRSTSPHAASHSYSAELPRPPRITIPPPVPTSFPAAPLAPAKPTYTDVGDSLLLTIAHALVYYEWKYESRRSAQAILPNLHLGPLPSARNSAYLMENGITQTIAIRNYKTAGVLKLNSEIDPTWPVERLVVDVGKTFNDMLQAFREVKTHIDDHFFKRNPQLAEGRAQLSHTLATLPGPIKEGKTLLYCESGNERSAACAVAYVMRTFEVGTISAVQYVQSRRFCIGFSEEVKGLLVTYEGILRAQRECLGPEELQIIRQEMAVMRGQGARKRGSDEVYESDNEGGRDGVAPFNGSQGDVEMDM
ncbi:phosphatases II [Ascobolus immersus RN42]|uniref:Phosphatases II n=1 Tax=Ascobolus immersus RN42 TaxID=1160509 RepID=A0A3N4IKM0_ASCIM|nr:phosphatases II [Ascobolus immersus RN42]